MSRLDCQVLETKEGASVANRRTVVLSTQRYRGKEEGLCVAGMGERISHRRQVEYVGISHAQNVPVMTSDEHLLPPTLPSLLFWALL